MAAYSKTTERAEALLKHFQASDLTILQIARKMDLHPFVARTVLMVLTGEGSVIPVKKIGLAYVYGLPRGREALLTKASQGDKLLQMLKTSACSRHALCGIFKYRSSDLETVIASINSAGPVIFSSEFRPPGRRGKPTVFYFTDQTRDQVPTSPTFSAILVKTPTVPVDSYRKVHRWTGDLPTTDAFSSMVTSLSNNRPS